MIGNRSRHACRIAAITALALLSWATPLLAQPPRQCQQRLLQELGWRFETRAQPTIGIHPGRPCDRADLAQAHAAGDLVVRVPAGLDAAARERLNRRLLRHPATHCAYGFALGTAARRAIDQLVANRGFRFTAVQIGWIGFGPTGSLHDGWRPISLFGRGYRPLGANSRAIQAFYHRQVRGECGLGRQVAQYATLAELYGMDGFDAEFASDEIVIGTFNRLHSTRSILLGSSAGEFSRDGRAEHAAQSGRQAFMALPGFIFHVFDRGHLDDINNQAENFVVYDVAQDAAQALRRHDGFEHYNRLNRRIWELSRELPGQRPKRFFERLLYQRDPALRAALSPADAATVARIDAELDDPFYRGFRIYVHKLGVEPVGFHIARLLDRNPRTPFRIELGLHNLHTTLYQRYVAHRLRECAAASIEASR